MPRRYDYYLEVGEGSTKQTVGYSLTQRGGYYGIRFLGPDGKRLEKMTQCRKKDANLTIEATKILVEVYAPVSTDLKRVTWDEAIEKVEATAGDLRPDTKVAYKKAVRVLRATLEKEGIKPTSPAHITPALATRFGREWLAGTYQRSTKSDAKTYPRRPITLAFYYRQLSALWVQFLELEYVTENPWKSVRTPQTDKVRKPVPTEVEINGFFAWVTNKYPRWERLHALLELKAVSGCRSLDICQLRSDQVRSGKVTWTAAQVKQREGRSVLLSDDLFKKLERLAGPTYLWEHFLKDMAEFRKSKNRRSETFSPKTVYWVMNNIFREYGEEHPLLGSLTPHSLRRRAITLVATATQSVDATAQAIGLHPSTARDYYLDSQRAFNTDELFKKLAGVLTPKSKAAASTEDGPH